MGLFRILMPFCLVIMATFIWGGAFAQNNEIQGIPEFNPSFEPFELPNGHMGNSVQGIVQDSVGFLWFASQSGLHRFDGQNMITFLSDPGNPNTLNNDYIEDIYLDSKGIIWLSHWSAGGISSYDPDQGTFRRYIHDPDDPESIIPGETGPIVEDNEGYLWIGGRNGISRLDRESGKFRRYKHDPGDPSSLSDNEVRGLYVDTSGELWVATGMPWVLDGKGGLNRYDPDKDSFERFLHDPEDPSSLSNNKVRALFEDSKGNFWVGTAGDGLHQFNKEQGTFTRFPYDPKNPGKLSKPFLESTDALTMAAEADISDGIPWSHITSIFEDSQQRIWISAVYAGIDVYDPKLGTTQHFESQPGKNKLKSNFIWQTYQSDDGTIWIATGGEGRQVYRVKEEGLKIPFYSSSLLNDSTSVKRGIVKDNQDNVWIAQSPFTPFDPIKRSALWKVDTRQDTVIQVNAIPSDISPYLPVFLASVSLDSSGNIWLGTNEGYYRGNEENDFNKIQADLEIGWGPVLQSSTGDIWIPHAEIGVFRFDSDLQDYEFFTHDPTDPNSISGSHVWGMFEDEQGKIWIGGGSPNNHADFPLFLDRYNPESKTFEHYLDKFTSLGMVSQIVEDALGNIWFDDWYYSLYKLNPTTRELKKFTPGNSLFTGNRVQSLIQYPNGNIWISTDYELLELDPATESFSIYNEIHGVRKSRGNTMAGLVTDDGDLLFVREGGFNIFNPNSLLREVKNKLPDLRITGFRLSDQNIVSGVSGNSEGVLKKPIWKTDLIELDNDENTFSFSVACFDFYEPEGNQLQYMLEGHDRRWRQDLRNGETPSYYDVPPGEYTFRLRGANSLGVWNTEGISLKVIIYPPWYLSWWAYLLYSIILVVLVLSAHNIQKNRTIRKERERIKDWELEQAKKVEQAYEELKTTQTQLIHSEKMASLGELTAGIAHEIQNPLNFVNNFSEVNKELVEELKEELEKENLEEAKAIAMDISDNEDKVIHHGKRASGIVKGMLDHSRASSSQKVPTDINALADEYLRLAYHGLRAKDKSFNATMETDFDDSIEQVEVVSQDIGRVILNLITNAFHAASDKAKDIKETDQIFQPTVSVETRQLNDSILVSIKDNGNGVPDSLKDKIFQPFFTTKATGQGTGLGLSMSYDIVTKGHGGQLTVKSEEGEGAEFIIKLPKT